MSLFTVDNFTPDHSSILGFFPQYLLLKACQSWQHCSNGKHNFLHEKKTSQVTNIPEVLQKGHNLRCCFKNQLQHQPNSCPISQVLVGVQWQIKMNPSKGQTFWYSNQTTWDSKGTCEWAQAVNEGGQFVNFHFCTKMSGMVSSPVQFYYGVLLIAQ